MPKLQHGCIPTPHKPAVDEQPSQWTQSGEKLNLFELSQMPFLADAWKRRREEKVKQAHKDGKQISFTKMDLTSLIVARNLCSKDCLIAFSG